MAAGWAGSSSQRAETTLPQKPGTQRERAQEEAAGGENGDAVESEASGEKAPEEYSGSVVVYSPHDADPLNAGVNLFMEKYPNVNIRVYAVRNDFYGDRTTVSGVVTA